MNFEKAWRSGPAPRIEEYIARVPSSTRSSLISELVQIELYYRLGAADPVAADEYCRRFPEVSTDQLAALVEAAKAENELAGKATSPQSLPRIETVVPPQPGPDTMIGPYRLLDRIGQGGMGTVFRALQTEPVEREVALKVVKPGLESRQFVARFEAERQALALMDHPNIARVLDAGTTDDGRPFFVMELVQGITITEHCDAHRLSIRQRLELFLQVCRAVQHAHQKGVIHRDLKPSNVLVTVYDGSPVPKVIDFGVVKITGPTVTDRTTFTGWGTLVGTLQYMSPEQAELNQLDIDTRCDIYSLSVLLYELLTGTTPLVRSQLHDLGLLEVLRMIREEEPARPSARISTLREASTASANRQSDPRRLTNLLRGELDWIVMKGLEKERDRRYATTNGLAADIRRYLDDEPVHARPPSAWYRFCKLARRNKVILSTASLVMASLLLGTVLSTWQAFRASEAKYDAFVQMNRAQKAEQEAKDSENVARVSEADTAAFAAFLVENVLMASRPEGEQGGLGIDTTVLVALESAEASMESVFRGQPRAELIARQSMGVTWRHLRKYQSSERHLRRAVELATSLYGPTDDATLKARNSLGVLLDHMGRREDAVQELEEVLRLRIAEYGTDDPRTLNTMSNLGLAYEHAQNFAEAVRLLEEVFRKRQEVLGLDDSQTLVSMRFLGSEYARVGRLPESIQLLEDARQRSIATLGEDDRGTLATAYALAETYQSAGRHEDSIDLMEDAVRIWKQKEGPEHLSTVAAMGLLAFAYRACGRLDEAVELLRETLRVQQAKLGSEHRSTLVSLRELAHIYRAAGRPEDALPLIEQVLEIQRVQLGAGHRETLQTMNALAATFWSTGQLDRSVPLFEELLSLHKEKFDEDHPHTLAVMLNLATNYRDAARIDEAMPLFEETLRRMHTRLGKQHPLTLATQHNMSVAWRRQERWDKALPLLEASLEGQRARLPAESPKLAMLLEQLGECLLETGQPAAAEPLLREGLAIAQKTLPDSWYLTSIKSLLGASLLGQKKYVEAETYLLDGYEAFKVGEAELPAQWQNRCTRTRELIVQLYQDWNKPEQAANWQ